MTRVGDRAALGKGRANLIGDLVAGISVALVLIPQSLAYAEIAGVPAYVGLSASALPPLLAAWFASSPYLQTGPVALTSLLTFGALSSLADTGTDEYIKLAALLALIAGAMRLIMGLFKMGWVAYIMTRPVVLGFTSAAAVLILSSQLPKVFGIETDKGVLGGAFEAISEPGRWELAAILISLFTIALMMGGRWIHLLFPGVLVAVVLVLIWSELVDYDGSVVGELPGGYPTPSLDLPWDRTFSLVLSGLIIALVGFAEPASIARTYSRIEKRPWDASRELVSQGVANLASGVAGAFPVGGSFSRTSLAHLAGAKTRLAGAITGAFVLLMLPAAPLLANLPSAVLGAIVFAAVIKLIKVVEIARLWTTARVEAAVASFTFAVTLLSSPRVEFGVIAGIAASAAAYLTQEAIADSPDPFTSRITGELRALFHQQPD